MEIQCSLPISKIIVNCIHTTILYVLGKIRGIDKLWFLGDVFVLNTYSRYCHQQPEEEFYIKRNFEVSAYMSNKNNSLDQNMVSRYRNLLVGILAEQIILPKLLVVVPDDDLITYVNHQTAGLTKILDRVINWLMKEYSHIIDAQKDYLPVKAKRNHLLQIVWIEAPHHDNFMDIDNEMRAKFNACLRTIGKLYDNVSVLELKKIWDPTDSNLFLKDAYRFTADGMKAYWKAVDHMMQFCDSTIMKHVEKQIFKSQLPFKKINQSKYKWKSSSSS